jgi:hypothetical protein
MTAAESVEALLHGWLKDVNWHKRTAQLHRQGMESVQLRFQPSLDGEVARLATQFVEVKGHGRFNKHGKWRFVAVERIEGDRSWQEPFELEEFLNDPNPKIFDSEKMVTASEPFDVDAFIRVIHEGRDVGQKDPID